MLTGFVTVMASLLSVWAAMDNRRSAGRCHRWDKAQMVRPRGTGACESLLASVLPARGCWDQVGTWRCLPGTF
jgi:hypothetical protein